jgi:S1-C subfamily serine protease
MYTAFHTKRYLVIGALTAVAAFTLATGAQAEAKSIPKAQPVRPVPTPPQAISTYKLRNGAVALMSESQKNIANGWWRPAIPQNIAREAARITVTIVVKKNDGSSMLGTGFVCDYTQVLKVLTNWHVVRDAKSITVIDSNQVRYDDGTISNHNPSLDLAMINIPSANNGNLKSNIRVVTDSDWEQIGEKVYVYGNPQGVEGTFSEGMISASRANGAIFQISAPLDHGSSGSPVFNEYGLLIGIVSSKIDSSAQLNFAISSNAIMEALSTTNDDHPKGFNLGIITGLDLRGKDDIAVDTAFDQKINDAYEQILADVKLCSPDKAAADAWAIEMHKYSPWNLDADYWINKVVKRYNDGAARQRLITDVNTLLKLQARAPLKLDV